MIVFYLSLIKFKFCFIKPVSCFYTNNSLYYLIFSKICKQTILTKIKKNNWKITDSRSCYVKDGTLASYLKDSSQIVGKAVVETIPAYLLDIDCSKLHYSLVLNWLTFVHNLQKKKLLWRSCVMTLFVRLTVISV